MRRHVSFAAMVFTLALACKSRDDGTTSGSALREGENGAAATAWSDLEPAEIYAESAGVFGDVVNRIDLYMAPQTFNRVTRHKDQGGDACRSGAPYGHVGKFRFTQYRADASPQVTELKDVGIRVRGNTSCGNYVKQYRLKFSETKLFHGEHQSVELDDSDKQRIKRQSLYGLKSISLRHSTNDRTFLRDALASEVFAYGDHLLRLQARPGAPARGGSVYRVGFAKVYLHQDGDETFLGLFNVAEQIDKTLYASRFDKDVIDYAFQANLARGNLADIPASDARLFEAYEPDVVGGKDFDDENPEQVADAKAKLTGLINAIKEADAAADLRALVDVDNVLNYMVAANLTGHWDSLEANANNDYVVHNAKTGLWQIVVWDLDNTFGSIATNNSQFNTVWNTAYDRFEVGSHDMLESTERPLFAKMMVHFHGEYTARYKEFLSGTYDLHALNDRIVKRRDMLVTFGELPMLQGYGGDPRYHAEWEILFSFKNHRWAHATCNIFQHGKRAKVDGLTVVIDYPNKKPSCVD